MSKSTTSTSDAEPVAGEAASPKRAPVYHVFEWSEEYGMWNMIASNVHGATDRKAIQSVIAEFEDDRRLGQFAAVLAHRWKVRQRKRTVHEVWA